MHQRTKIAIAVAMAINSLGAYAQAPAATAAQPEAIKRVEVTGSRIRQVDLETAQPLLTINQEQIQKSGLITVGDILNNLTSAGSPAFSRGGTLTSNREQGGQYIDMRNLGAERLLVLVNGKRWTQTVDGYTDMSTVPASMIEKIDIQKDGASATYGSDAIAGVVNIILKKKLDGVHVSAYTGQNEKGDGKTNDFSLAYGASTEKSSIMFGVSHSKQGEVFARDREITATTYGPAHRTDGFGASPWGRIRQVNATGAASGFNRILNHTGGADGDGTGSNSRDPNSYHPYASAEQDNFNSTSQMMFQAPTKLTSIFTKGTLELPNEMRLTSTAMYAQRDSSRQVAGYPLNSLTQSRFPVYIDKNSYFNPYGSSVAANGVGEDLFFYRRTIEVPRVTDNKNQTAHFDAALEGDFNLRSLPWTWSTGFNHSSVNGTNTSTGNLNLLNLKKALGPSFRNASGQIQCGTATAPIASAECVPFNILGGPSASSPEALAYVMSRGQGTYGSTVQSITADVSGEVLTLPAGAVALAGGLEKRTVRGYDRPGQFEQSGFSTDLAGNSTDGKYTVKEAYLEVGIPLLKGKPFAELLSVNLASRHSDYSNFGKTTNSKASFMWKPINDLLTRGTFAEGFRAPSVGDSFGGGTQSYDNYIDSCDRVNGEAAKDATTSARCDAAGVPRDYRQRNQAGVPVASGGGQSTVPFQGGAGNDKLTPETATTKSLGLVYSPAYVPGLSLSLDWFDIRVKDRITAISANYTIEQCYEKGVQSYCDNIKRDNTGLITNLSRGNANLGQMATEGIDVGMRYRLPRGSYGQFSVSADATYIDSFRIKSSPEAEFDEYDGQYDYNRVKSNIGVDWKLGKWSATWTTRFFSAIKTQCWATDEECSDPGMKATWGTDVNKRSALWYHDLSVGYETPWKGKILVGANNLFDKKPRVVYDANSGFNGDSSSSSVDPDAPLDRFVYVRYTQSF